MEHLAKKVLLPLIALLLSSVPSLAQNTITIFHATTVDQVRSVVSGIQNVGINPGGPGLYVFFDEAAAEAYAAQLAANNLAAGMTGPATVPYVLNGVITDGATIGHFMVDETAGVSNLPMGLIGGDVSFATEVQQAVLEFDAIEAITMEGNASMVLHASATPFVGWWNGTPNDLSIVVSAQDILNAEKGAQSAASQAQNIIVAKGDAVSQGTLQQLQNVGTQVAKDCSFYCGAVSAVAVAWANLKIGLQMTGESIADGAAQTGNFLVSGGMGGVTSAAATLGGVMICDATLDNLCSNNINTSLSLLIFGPDSGTGPTLVSQTFNPFTGALEMDYSDGSTIWARNNGIVTGIIGGVGVVQNPDTGVDIGIATPIDGQDLRNSQILQVNFGGQIKYLTQAGFSDTLEDAQAAVAGTTALNSPQYKYPAMYQVPAVVTPLDPNGKPTPPSPPDQSGTTITTGKTSQGNDYTTTVQKDSSGNIVAEYTVTIGTNFTTSKDDLTGTSQTIERNPDGSTTMFNCIQNQTVCASSNGGIVNYDDGWNGNNPYDASNQSFTLSLPGYSGVGAGGGGGGGSRSTIIPPGSVPDYRGCDEFGC